MAMARSSLAAWKLTLVVGVWVRPACQCNESGQFMAALTGRP